MTTIAAGVVNTVDSLIETYGDDIIIYSPTESFSSYYHDKTTTWSSGTTAKGLVVRSSKNLLKEAEGELQRNRTIRMYIKSSETIGTNYKVSHNSITYNVNFVEAIRAETTNLYYIVEMSRINST